MLELTVGALVVLIFAIIIAIYAGWGGGANDMANAMGTSVGSGALTFMGAVVVGGIFEFAGAVLVGRHVTETVRSGIVDPTLFAGDHHTFIAGMLAAMLAAAIWMTLASYFSMPVSTTHSIVGAVAGFGVAALGFGGVQWGGMVRIVSSWVVSPVVGGLIGFLLFNLVKVTVLDRVDPVASLRRWGPAYVGLTVFVLILATLFKGLDQLNLDLEFFPALQWTLILSLIISLAFIPVFRRIHSGPAGTAEQKYRNVERLFIILQIITAASVAFAHGANDVANYIGPLAAIWVVLDTGGVVTPEGYQIPIWIFALGGAAIVFGLATYGRRVVQTIGRRITEITPSRGFSAELSAAATILFASHMGMPISTTHTLVGAVIGVGLARGIPALNLQVLIRIGASWVATLPVAGGTSFVLFFIIRPFLGA
jgi:inorganic phosphate transporter, PiT family